MATLTVISVPQRFLEHFKRNEREKSFVYIKNTNFAKTSYNDKREGVGHKNITLWVVVGILKHKLVGGVYRLYIC